MPEVQPRDQGWKLHISATLASADEVLRRAVPVLIEAGAPFKVASTAADLASLNSNHCPRPSSGKFITVYPSDDDQAMALMASLDLPQPVYLGPRSSPTVLIARVDSSTIAMVPSGAALTFRTTVT